MEMSAMLTSYTKIINFTTQKYGFSKYGIVNINIKYKWTMTNGTYVSGKVPIDLQ